MQIRHFDTDRFTKKFVFCTKSQQGWGRVDQKGPANFLRKTDISFFFCFFSFFCFFMNFLKLFMTLKLACVFFVYNKKMQKKIEKWKSQIQNIEIIKYGKKNGKKSLKTRFFISNRLGGVELNFGIFKKLKKNDFVFVLVILKTRKNENHFFLPYICKNCTVLLSCLGGLTIFTSCVL